MFYIFSLIFILKLDEPYRNTEEIFIISLFFTSSDLGCRSKQVQIWVAGVNKFRFGLQE